MDGAGLPQAARMVRGTSDITPATITPRPLFWLVSGEVLTLTCHTLVTSRALGSRYVVSVCFENEVYHIIVRHTKPAKTGQELIYK